MRRSFPFIALLAVLLFGGFGCTSTEVIKPVGLSTTELDATTRRGNAAIKLNSELRLTFPPPRREGYIWQIAHNDTRFLRPLSDFSAPDAVTGRTSISFHAVRSGRATLKFLALPMNSPAQSLPVDQYDVVVVIQ